MHLLELTEEQRQHHDSSNNCKLRGLEVNWPEMEPTAGAINFLAHELRQDEKENARHVHRKRTPSNPPVIDQAGNHKGKEAHYDPVRLLPPKISRDRVFAHISGAVDGDHPKNR